MFSSIFCMLVGLLCMGSSLYASIYMIYQFNAPLVHGLDEVEKRCTSCTDKKTDIKASKCIEGGLLNLNPGTNVWTKIGIVHIVYLKTYFVLSEMQLIAKVLSPVLGYSLPLYDLFGWYKYKFHLSINDAVITVGKLNWRCGLIFDPFLREQQVILLEFSSLGL